MDWGCVSVGTAWQELTFAVSLVAWKFSWIAFGVLEAKCFYRVLIYCMHQPRSRSRERCNMLRLEYVGKARGTVQARGGCKRQGHPLTVRRKVA